MGEKLIRAGRLYYHLYLSMCFLPFFFCRCCRQSQKIAATCSWDVSRWSGIQGWWLVNSHYMAISSSMYLFDFACLGNLWNWMSIWGEPGQQWGGAEGGLFSRHNVLLRETHTAEVVPFAPQYPFCLPCLNFSVDLCLLQLPKQTVLNEGTRHPGHVLFPWGKIWPLFQKLSHGTRGWEKSKEFGITGREFEIRLGEVAAARYAP